MIFAEKMDKLDARDISASFQKIEDYIAYMCERIDHSTTIDRKRIDEELKALKRELGIK